MAESEGTPQRRQADKRLDEAVWEIKALKEDVSQTQEALNAIRVDVRTNTAALASVNLPEIAVFMREASSNQQSFKDAVTRLFGTLETLTKTVEAHTPDIEAFTAHVEEEGRTRAMRDSQAQTVQQQLSFMVAAVKDLQLRNAQEDHRSFTTRNRNRAVIRSAAGASGLGALTVLGGYISGTGRLASVSFLLAAGAVVGLLGLAALCMWVSQPVPSLTPIQAAPITEIPPKPGP